MISFSKYINKFVNEKITVNKEARTGNILNQRREVDIDGLIGINLLFLLILIWSQKIDNGYMILVKLIKKAFKLPSFV